jgi:hypothetical protein
MIALKISIFNENNDMIFGNLQRLTRGRHVIVLSDFYDFQHAGRACTGRACAGKIRAGNAYVGRGCAGRECAVRECASSAYASRVCMNK